MAPAVAQESEAQATPQARRSRHVGGASGQRDRLIGAMGELVAEVGLAAVGVHHVCQRAGMSRRTFYDLYDHRDECFIDTLREASDRLLAHVEEAVGAAGTEWDDRAVAATRALIDALDADRVMARLCIVSALAGDEDAIALRHGLVDRIVALLDDAPVPGGAAPTEMVLAVSLGGVCELVHRRLTDEPDRSLADLREVAAYLLLAPFAGRRRATVLAGQGSSVAFVTRWSPRVGSADHPGLVVTELTRETLRYLDAHPDATNVAIARAVDVRHESQMSRHLARLQREGVVQCRKEGRTNAWRLTARGQEAARSLREPRAEAPRLTDSAWSAGGRTDA
jgi:AcrR family transcriptional regulator